MAQAQDDFARGTAAFKSGEYRRALALFETERRRGGSSAKLSYNIGVSHFKLGDYAEAGRWFERLLSYPQWRDLARFQLGLVAEKRDHRAQAREHYRAVQARAESARLRALSGKRLAALAPSEPRTDTTPGRWTALASASAGFTDNAFALQDQLLADSTLAEDRYSEVFAWGQYRLAGTAANGWRLQGFAYRRGYAEYDSLDIDSYNLGVSRDLSWNGWRLELGAAAESTSLGGESLARTTRFTGRLQRAFAGNRVSLAYLPGHYSGGSDYRHLDGWRHRVEAKLARPLGRATVNALYRLDIDDRADLERDNGDFYSYSPTRHSAAVELEWPLRDNWTLSAGVEYRTSDYDGLNTLTDTDGTVKEKVREGERVKSWLESQLYLSSRLRLAGKVSFADNEENFDLYTHDRTEASLGLRYIF